MKYLRCGFRILFDTKSWILTLSDSELKPIRHLWVRQNLLVLKIKVLGLESGSLVLEHLTLAPGYFPKQSKHLTNI